MKVVLRQILPAVALALAGCASSGPDGAAFSERWLEKEQKKRDFQRRQEAAYDFDGAIDEIEKRIVREEDGEPRLRVLRGKRIKSDLDMEGGNPSVSLKYELKWGGKKKLPPVKSIKPPERAEDPSEPKAAEMAETPPLAPTSAD